MFTKTFHVKNWELQFSIQKLFQIDQDGETYLARTGRFIDISWDYEKKDYTWFCFRFIFFWLHVELEYNFHLVKNELDDIPRLSKEECLEYRNLVEEETDKQFELEMKENGQKLF